MNHICTTHAVPNDTMDHHSVKPFQDMSVRFTELLRSNRRSFQGGTILRIEGGDSGSVYVVQSGWLAVSKSMSDGARQIVDIVLPGGIINPSSADASVSSVQLETLSISTVSVVPSVAWARFLETDPQARDLVTLTIAAALSRMSERMLRLGKGTAQARVAYALIELCMRLAAIGGGNGGVYHLPLTQQLLGEYVGLSSVHVCRTMRRMTRDGVITMSDHMNILIHDLDRLAEIAGIDVETLKGQIIGNA